MIWILISPKEIDSNLDSCVDSLVDDSILVTDSLLGGGDSFLDSDLDSFYDLDSYSVR